MNASEPSVSVVVLNHSGREHLKDCFDSLFDLDYPAERLEVICVDNGSEDDSVEYLRESFPKVKVVEAGENLGFAAGCNLGAGSANGEFLALVNNDMRVDRQWLRGLLAPIDTEAGVVCAGGRILSWDGESVDFERGLINFYGMASQAGSGAPADEASPYEGPLLFASGGSLLVHRGVYLDAGGMDANYFAFFEDVDLGWRLRLYGYQVVSAPDAISYHRFHGTAGKIADFRLLRLYERNALFTLIKNVGEEALNRLLLAAFMLAVRRARFEAAVAEGEYRPQAGRADDEETVKRRGLATLLALDDVVAGFSDLLRRRREVQERRVVSDAEVFGHLGRPLHPNFGVDAYLRSQAELTRLLGIDELFPLREASRVLLSGSAVPELEESWSETVQGWAERLSGFFETTVIGAGAPERTERLLETHEAAVLHLTGADPRWITGTGPLVILDLRGVEPADAPRWREVLGTADAFTVASPSDIKSWSDALEQLGVQRPHVVAADGSLDGLHEIFRRPYELWTRRAGRGLGRATDEVGALALEWDRKLVKQEHRVSELEESVRGYERLLNDVRERLAAANEEIERLRNHFVMRGYVRLRQMIPIKGRKQRGYRGDG